MILGFFITSGLALAQVYYDPNGNVGIGTMSPEAKLHVEGIVEVDYKIQANDSKGLELATDEGTTRLFIKDNGNIGIRKAKPSYSLEVYGTAGKPGGGTWADSSDERLKKNVQPLTGALDKLIQLRGVAFEWINPEEHSVQGSVQEKELYTSGIQEKGAYKDKEGIKSGLIAQDVEKVFPDWVLEIEPEGKDKELVTEGEKIKAIYFPHAFNAYVIEALRELKEEIGRLKEENIALRARIEKFKP